MITIWIKDIIPMLDSEVNIYISASPGYLKKEISRLIHEDQEVFKGDYVPVHCKLLNPGQFKEEFIGKNSDGYFRRAAEGTLLLEDLDEADTLILTELLNIYSRQEYTNSDGNKVPLNWRTIVTSKNAREKINDDVLQLYERMLLFEVNIPDLSNRTEDIAPLAMIFLSSAAEKRKKQLVDITEDNIANLLVTRFKHRSTLALRTALEHFIQHGNTLTLTNITEFIERKYGQTDTSKAPRIEFIELIPKHKKGNKHRNEVLVTYSHSSQKPEPEILRDEIFSFLYLLCLERLDGKRKWWMSLDDKVDSNYIETLENKMGRKLRKRYTWIEEKNQKRTMTSLVNEKIPSLIIPVEKNDLVGILKEYITLTTDLSGKKSIVLHKLK